MKAHTMSKLQLVQGISKLYGGPIESLGPGSKERKSLLLNLAAALGIPVDPRKSKQKLAKFIVEHTGGSWDASCESVGQTITEEGLIRIQRSASQLSAASARAPASTGSICVEEPTAALATRARAAARQGQLVRDQKFRKKVLDAWGRKCMCCSVTQPELLEAAHIVAVADDGADVPTNGVPLCVLHHRMLDKGFLEIKVSGNKCFFEHSSGVVSRIATDIDRWLWPCTAPQEIVCPPNISRDAFRKWCKLAQEIRSAAD